MERGRLPVAVIAAAGRARRFQGVQKVLAEVGGLPAVCRVARACEEGLGPHYQVVVVGHEAERVRGVLGEASHREFVLQEPQLGTGHALKVALARLHSRANGEVYFFCGDKPLLAADSVRLLKARFLASGAAMAFLTSELEGDPRDSRQGRVVQMHRGTSRAEVLAIVEKAAIDALDGRTMSFRSLAGLQHEFGRERLLAIRDVNISAYVWRTAVLRKHIGKLRPHPESGEYLITDLVEILRRRHYLVRAFPACNGQESIGIDTRELLEKAKEAWAELRRTARPLVVAPGQATSGLQ